MPSVPPKAVRPRLEHDIQDEIRVALSKIDGVVCHRNNAGRVWIDVGIFLKAGLPATFAEKAVAACRAKFGNMRFGLAEGSADLIGSVLVKVAPMPGAVSLASIPSREIARSLAIEVKRPGQKPTDEQLAWQEYVRSRGWIVGVCTSAEEAVELIMKAKRWEI